MRKNHYLLLSLLALSLPLSSQEFVEKVNPQPRFGEFGDNEPGSDFILVVR